MFIKAIYEPTKQECWVNDNYVIDIFKNKDDFYILYTFDNERGAYIVTKQNFDEWQKSYKE